MAHTTTQTHTGVCPTHGGVQATREVPKIRFPFIVYGAMRLFASGKPYLCPSCGQPVKKD